jgi:hypothetical protein
MGAKSYFTRGVLHNHPDHKVKLLLKNAATRGLTIVAAFTGMKGSGTQAFDRYLHSERIVLKVYSSKPV